MIMKTTKRHAWATLCLFCTALLLTTAFAACSDSNDSEETKKPDTPINPGDWQSVPASGGTIEKGDIAISFPAGTFGGDTKVAITEVKKGTVSKEHEASTFYQLTLPVQTNKPFTVQVKTDAQDGDVEFVLCSPGYAISYKSDVTNGTTAETKHSNGVYTTTIPAFDSSDSNDNVSIVVGLCKRPDDSEASRMTRASISNKYKNIKWKLDIDYWFTDSPAYRLLSKKLTLVDSYIEECVKTIYDLGFRLPDSVTINYHIADTDSWIFGDSYGYYARSLICRSLDGIWLKDQIAMATGAGDKKLLKQTIIHETLHNFQSYYHLHYYRNPTGDHMTMYEIGAIWIEKFMNNGKTNGVYQMKDGGLMQTFTRNFRTGLSQSSTDVKELYEDYAEQGYALGPLLYYMISKNYSRGFDDKTIISFYDFWARITQNGYTLIDVLNEWYNTTYKENFFNGTDAINDYYLGLWKGEVMSDFNISAMEQYVTKATKKKIDLLSEKNSKLSLDGKVYPYGGEGLYFKMDETCFLDSTLNNDELVIKQEAKDVKTYLLYSKGGKIMQYPKVAVKGDSICVPGSELEAWRTAEGFNNYFFLLTVREKGSLSDKGTIPTKTRAELRYAPKQSEAAKFISLSIEGTLNLKWTSLRLDGETVSYNSNYSPSLWLQAADKNTTISTKLNGSTLHVDAVQKLVTEKVEYGVTYNIDATNHISFDLENFASPYTHSSLKNLIVSVEDEEKGTSKSGVTTMKATWNMKASYVPFNQTTTTQNANTSLRYYATVKDGLKVGSFDWSSEYEYDVKPGVTVAGTSTKSSTATYANRSDNYLDIRLEL